MSTAPEPRQPADSGRPFPPPREVMLDPAQIAYVSLDGTYTHWPAGTRWNAADLGNLDLAVLRALLVVALQRVENELGGRGLLDRVTPRLND